MSLPESWKHVPVKDVATLVSGGTPTRTDPRFFGGGIPWATPADATATTGLYLEKTAETVTEAGIRASSIVKLPAGSVLMTARATVGVVVIASEETTTSQDFVNFLPNPELINNKYLAHLLRFSKPEILRFSTGTTFAAVSQSAMAKWNVLLPSLLEQERIVSILEKAEDVQKQSNNIQNGCTKFITLLFQEVFGGTQEQTSTLQLSEIAQVATGGTPSRSNARYFEGVHPWATSAELKNDFIDDTEEKLTNEGLKAVNGGLFPKGTILLAMYGQGRTRGRSAMLRIDSAINQACAAIVPRDPTMANFIWAWLQVSYDAIRELGQGGGRPNLNLEIVRNLRLPKVSAEKIKQFNVLFEAFLAWKEKSTAFSKTIGELQGVVLRSAFTGTLTEMWREKPEIAAILEEQARVSDTSLVRQELESSPESNEDSWGGLYSNLKLFAPQERISFAFECRNQLQVNQPLHFPTVKGNTAQWLDMLLKVADLASKSLTGQTQPETLEKLQAALQNTEDPTLQEVAGDISNMGLEARVAFNPDDPKHTRSHFWQEVQPDSPLRIVYNAMRITPGYSNLRTIMQTLADLNEPLEEHLVAQAIQTLETAGLIDAVTLEMRRSRNVFDEMVTLHAYRLPQPETQSNPSAEMPMP
jgi:type I restriction enzyme, S subunit